jgi:hypothetical protein
MNILLVYPHYPATFWTLFRKPRLFPLAITYAVYGYHFRKVTETIRGCGMFDSYESGEIKDWFLHAACQNSVKQLRLVVVGLIV